MRKTIKNSNIWRLNNKLLNNKQITEEIKKEIKICIEMNENENTTPQNLWDTVIAVLESRLLGEISINSDMTPSLWQKVKN